MVIFFDKDTLEIKYTEGSVNKPTLPSGTEEEQRIILGEDNIDFIAIDKEMGIEVYNYKINVNINDGENLLVLKDELT